MIDHQATTPEMSGARAVGRSVPRVEDAYLTAGLGTFVDDIDVGDALAVSFVRSPLAAGELIGIDSERAREWNGVVAVLTAAEFARVDGMRPMLSWDSFMPTTLFPLAVDAVRYVGEPVAMVLAENRYTAEDAAELIDVTYGDRAVVSTAEQAMAPDSPLVHEDVAGNCVLDVTVGDPAADEELDKSDAVVRVELESGRQSACPMEAHACIADWDARGGRLRVYTSTQVPHLVRTAVAKALQLDENRVQVVAPDVGGGFGMKCAVSREEVAIAAAAYVTRQPVKWIADRQESLLSAFQGRQQRYSVSAAFTKAGDLRAVVADIVCDIGAFHCYPFTCAVEVLAAPKQVPGPYRFPHYRARSRGVLTNKPPMAPYRGVSGPQTTLVIERLMDKAARQLGLDPVEIRRRNLVADNEFPYSSPGGAVYDAGSYRESLERCASAIDYSTWRQRQQAAKESGRLIGLGFSCFIEGAAFGTATYAARGMDIVPGTENVSVRMDPSGSVEVLVGTHSQGQGHATTYAQIVADELGITPDRVHVRQGDTDLVPHGWGTFASRSVMIGGTAAHRSAALLADRLRRVAAQVLEAAPEDIELTEGRIGVRGVPASSVDVGSVASTAYHGAHLLTTELRGGLEATASFDSPGTFSNATHAAVVEIDPGTGKVHIERYVVVEDCGVVINPRIVEGQVRGAVAQGIASALYEKLSYDHDGQANSATLMDYLVPTAQEIPDIEIHHLETPCSASATGAKGMAEGGTIGAPAAVINAVNDALSHLDVSLDSVPVTPEDVLSAQV